MTATLNLPDAAIENLRSTLRGDLLQPGQDGYDDARHVWNAMIDQRPTLVARCRGAGDVIAAVNFAREHGVLVSVRGGGHNIAGKAVAGGLMIDQSHMKSVRVDPRAMTVRAEGGVLWGELDRETAAFGLASPGGTVATTGIAGLTLGGGQGWLNGKYGFVVDNLLSADVVTADGRLLHASATDNEDLFWGLRGAGANLGVVTSFEYRLHPLSTVLGGMVIHPFERAAEVLRFYREFSASQPDELTTWVAVLTSPDGNLVIAMVTCYSGRVEEGEQAVEPLRRFGPPVADTIAPISYVAMQQILTEVFPPGRLNYWKTGLTGSISDHAIEEIVEHTRRIPSPYTAVAYVDTHGAVSRVGKTETAYYHRDLQYDFLILAAWLDPAETEKNIGWTRDFFEAMRPTLANAVYVNDLGDEGDERARSAYGGNYERLAALKKKYDPTNFFRLNQNIQPAP
jgi:FAD/FMN-containing dehydrogenase